jgi:glc operon protein GlcG
LSAKPPGLANVLTRKAFIGLIAITPVAAAARVSATGAIDYSDAESISGACFALAMLNGWKMQVAILEEHGDLIRFVKMDGASRATGVLALEKAKTVSRSGRSTRAMAKMDPSGQRVFDAVTIAGGLPFLLEDRVVGAVGVSGSSPDNDERCAQAGIDAAR